MQSQIEYLPMGVAIALFVVSLMMLWLAGRTAQKEISGHQVRKEGEGYSVLRRKWQVFVLFEILFAALAAWVLLGALGALVVFILLGARYIIPGQFKSATRPTAERYLDYLNTFVIPRMQNPQTELESTINRMLKDRVITEDEAIEILRALSTREDSVGGAAQRILKER